MKPKDVKREDQATRTEIDAAYISRKSANGYTATQISTKREALRSTMWPQPVEQIEDEIVAAGWSAPECIWRSLQFAAWVAEKPTGSRLAA